MTTRTASTNTLSLPDADIAYDVYGPLPTADGRPPIVAIGQPMDATGFRALGERLDDRTLVAYDPRGMGRSVRHDGRTDNDPHTQAADVHALIESLDVGPVDMFASSGGAITSLALVAAHPGDVRTLVAHEPPVIAAVPDAEATERARIGYRDAYMDRGWGAGMAAFMQMTGWQGEFTDEYFAQPAADPAAFGMPTEDDGSRDDPLLSDRSVAVIQYRPDVAALTAAPTRIVLAYGRESAGTFTARAAIATAGLLGLEPVEFPSHHGGFVGGEFGWPGEPDAFAARLREVLDAS